MSRWIADLSADVCPRCGINHVPPGDWEEDASGDGRLDHALESIRHAHQPAPQPLERPRTADPVSGQGLSPQTRRERVSQLLARAKSGDLSALEAIRGLIGGDDAA